ncbi:MAG: family 10 glycosylhydrolase [Ignavibacteriae bacterium]|nr:family 10 glycosylhydrolase [Ignavibacteriota bacterium]
MQPHIALVLLIICIATSASSQSSSVSPPKREVRGVWITTATGLDWPKSTVVDEQKNSLRTIVQNLKQANFNTIFFQVRARGDAYYRSQYEPWAENLTGTLGKDPGWDPLALLLEEAHKRGMEVHAWFNLYKVRGLNPAGPSSPQHPTRAYPHWVRVYQDEAWLDPGIPEVREYLIRVALDLVRNYDIDGINFDFIRYPGKDFPDMETHLRYGNGMSRDDWRRSNIDKFVSEFYDRAMAIKPMLKVGSAPLAIYQNSNLTGSYYTYAQDSYGWLKKQKHDYLSPQMYWSLGGNNGEPNFATLSRAWKRYEAGRHIYAGIGAYKPDVVPEIPAEIDTTRVSGLLGQVYFRYDNIERLDMFGNRYRTPANIPPMPWKDNTPPMPPKNLAVTELTPNVFHLEWLAPTSATDGDRARGYNIYRSATLPIPVDDPTALVAITTAEANYFIDTVRTPTAFKYFYAVSALDKGNNESDISNAADIVLKEMVAIRGKLFHATSLSMLLANGGAPTLVAYKIADKMNVSLEVIEQRADELETTVTTIARGTQEAGTYVVGLRNVPFRGGRYVVRLRAGDATIEQPLELRQ